MCLGVALEVARFHDTHAVSIAMVTSAIRHLPSEPAFDEAVDRVAERLDRDGVSGAEVTRDVAALMRRFPGRQAEIRCLLEAAHESPARLMTDALPPPCRLRIAPTPSSVGPFRLAERLGAGGMGHVYRGVDVGDPSNQVAVKVMRPEIGSPAIARQFASENRHLAAVCHPNITRHVGQSRQPSVPPHVIMELIPGTSLTEYCQSHCLGIEQRIDLLIQACAAVDHVHRVGILHHDLKPANLMVASSGAQSILKLIDFGLAESIGHGGRESKLRESTRHRLSGTLWYMSPERARCDAGEPDLRSDLFSLGAVMFELITLSNRIEQSFYRGRSLPERLEILENQEPIRPSDRVRSRRRRELIGHPQADGCGRNFLSWVDSPSLRDSLDIICLKAMARRPEDRYSNVREMSYDLQRALGQRLVGRLTIPRNTVHAGCDDE